MKFNIETFERNLKKHKVSNLETVKITEGISKVIDHVWQHSPTGSVDFDSFTLEDVANVMEEMSQMPLVYDEGGEMFTCDPSNLFFVYDKVFKVCFDLTNSENKKYELDEDDMFI